MLTIKHITPLGNESLFEVHEISYSPKVDPTDYEKGRTPIIGTVFFAPSAGSDMLELRDGLVYVMNDAGRTISKYNLGGFGLPGTLVE